MRIFYVLLLIWPIFMVSRPAHAAPPPSGPAMTVDHSAWTALLQAHIKTTPDGMNLFAYAQVSPRDKQALKTYIASLEATAVSSLPRNEQMAYWINLYNAKTIDVVLDHYPFKSIRDISLGGGLFTVGPWKKQVLSVEKRKLSLDNIEHDILRKEWREPRVHYALNCASFSCPNLASEAFTPRNLEKLLQAGGQAYVNHPRGVTIEKGKVTLSRIYQWYREDFGRRDSDILAHIASFANPALKKQLAGITEIDGYAYDWSLNEPKR